MEHRKRVYERYVHASYSEFPQTPEQAFAGCRYFVRDIIARYFPADRSARIVDLGCGHGAIMYFAREAGYSHVEGIDGSAEQVEAARRMGIAGVRHGDILDEVGRLDTASVDAVVTFDVIEHFTNAELVSLIDQVARVLRPDGRWIIHAPNGEALFAGRMRYWDITHERAFTRHSIRQILSVSGFARISCFEDQPVPHGVKSGARWVLWKGIRLFLRFLLAVETGDTGREAIFSQNLLAVAEKA